METTMMTMSKEAFFEAWREECREWFQILTVVRHDRRETPQPKQGACDHDAEEASRRQKFFRGPLLQDKIASGDLRVEGWVDPNRKVR